MLAFPPGRRKVRQNADVDRGGDRWPLVGAPRPRPGCCWPRRRSRQAAAGAVTYVHSLADPAEIRRFQGLGSGVYSDEPFPPLDAATSSLQLPAFGPDASRPPA
jgi:hypothetical protein